MKFLLLNHPKSIALLLLYAQCTFERQNIHGKMMLGINVCNGFGYQSSLHSNQSMKKAAKSFFARLGSYKQVLDHSALIRCDIAKRDLKRVDI